MATHSRTLAWKIPWKEEPGRLQSMGLWRGGHCWATSLSVFTFMHWRRKWQPTPVILPGESRTGEPGGLPSMGSHRVGHDWNDLAAAAAWFLKHIPQHIQPNLKVTVIEFRTISGQQRPNELERTSWDSLQDIYFSPTYVCKITIFLHYLTNSLC